MKNKFFSVILSITFCCSAHGSDQVADEFVDIGKKIAATLGRIETHLVPLIASATVKSEETVFLDGIEVDAANYPEQNLIIVNHSRWLGSATYPGIARQRTMLALHEYLWLGGYDENYQVSQIFMGLLENTFYCTPYCEYFQK